MPPFDRSPITLPSGLRLDWSERGTGPTCLLLHGYTDSWHSFERMLACLPGDVRAVAFSQRGHGDSDRPESGYDIASFAADAVAFMDAVGIRDVTLLGHSMGSLIAQEVALSRPDRVSRLVLVGSAASFDNVPVAELERDVSELTDPVPREFVHAFQASTVHRAVPEDFFRAVVSESMKVPARVWKAALRGIRAFQSAARLGRLTIPTLIAWGDHDQVAGQADQQLLQRTIRGSKLLCYEDTGHSPHWEEPQRFADDLLGFLRATS